MQGQGEEGRGVESPTLQGFRGLRPEKSKQGQTDKKGVVLGTFSEIGGAQLEERQDKGKILLRVNSSEQRKEGGSKPKQIIWGNIRRCKR